MSRFVAVIGAESAASEMPKSVTFTTPAGLISRLARLDVPVDQPGLVRGIQASGRWARILAVWA